MRIIDPRRKFQFFSFKTQNHFSKGEIVSRSLGCKIGDRRFALVELELGS